MNPDREHRWRDYLEGIGELPVDANCVQVPYHDLQGFFKLIDDARLRATAQGCDDGRKAGMLEIVEMLRHVKEDVSDHIEPGMAAVWMRVSGIIDRLCDAVYQKIDEKNQRPSRNPDDI